MDLNGLNKVSSDKLNPKRNESDNKAIFKLNVVPNIVSILVDTVPIYCLIAQKGHKHPSHMKHLIGY